MKKLVIALFALLLMSAPVISFAGEATSDIQIEINYSGGCSIQTNSINAQITSIAVNTTAQSSIKVTCAKMIPYTVILDQGQNASNGTRRAKYMDQFYMKYRLYSDSNMQNEISTSPFVAEMGTGEEQEHLVYFAVHANENPQSSTPVGTYRDTVEAKVVW